MTPATPPALRSRLAEWVHTPQIDGYCGETDIVIACLDCGWNPPEWVRLPSGVYGSNGPSWAEHQADALLGSEPLASLVAVAEAARAISDKARWQPGLGPTPLWIVRDTEFSDLRAALAALPREDDPA